ncbi:MAG: hypothetical protein R3B45_14905 [Bdellovibrionota bacterium]
MKFNLEFLHISLKTVLQISLAILSACSQETQQNRNTDEKSNAATNSTTDDETASKDPSNDESTCEGDGCKTTQTSMEVCKSPDSPLAQPGSIQEFIDLLNLLPKPTTINCVLQSLKRPLEITATSNRFSAQGATSQKSPRIFIQLKSLVLTFVPDGPEKNHIELAETTTFNQSIKGDLELPITETLQENSPFRSVFGGGEPACANLCHSNYTQIEAYSDGVVKYSSERIFPKESTIVPLIDLEIIREGCEGDNSQLCYFYRSLFDHGEINSFEFPKQAKSDGLPF